MMPKIKKIKTPVAVRGFTLLFAVLIGSILFSIGVAISHIALKEVILASSGKDSETAFYAADAGTECALLWDIGKGKTFRTYDSDSKYRTKISCNGQNIDLTLDSSNSTSATTSFSLALNKYCADVVVGKNKSNSTIVESRGRNDCEERLNPKRVERALRVRY